jgi:hypothetical protein
MPELAQHIFFSLLLLHNRALLLTHTAAWIFEKLP